MLLWISVEQNLLIEAMLITDMGVVQLEEGSSITAAPDRFLFRLQLECFLLKCTFTILTVGNQDLSFESTFTLISDSHSKFTAMSK